jgi:hypothetical protein
MSARDDLIYRITRHCSAETAEQLADAYRAEVLAKAIGRLRAIPVDCTALTGPVWYGDGWNSAITCLEGIADYQTPDDEAYPGELQRLRALALGLRVAALRKDDLAEAQRLLVVHAEHEMNVREKASVAAPTATPDFFQAGRTYTEDAPFRAPEDRPNFQCAAVAIHPTTGNRRALGFEQPGAGRPWKSSSMRDEEWADGWTDITDTTTGDPA